MRRWAFVLLSLIVALFASCKDATQVDVVVRSNVPYASGAGVAVWSSRSGTVGMPIVESAEPWLGDGELGNIVVTPGDAPKESPLTLRVTMGLRGKRAAECTDDGDIKDCIIARRKLAFVPHTHLRVPVVLYLACEGVKCDADTTCSSLGQCVSAQVDPASCASADGCTLPGEPPFVPGASVDGGGDAAPDAAISAEADATGSDVDATTDSGTAPTGPELIAGRYHTCARMGDGTVKCWGYNALGQLGLGDTKDRGDGPAEMGASLPSVDLGPGRTALQLAAGIYHTCARLDDGSVKCWGFNLSGQLGIGDTQARGDSPGQMGASLPTVNLGPGRTAVQLSARGYSTCARLDDGSVKCWGSNNSGQLGIGDTQDRGDGPGEMGGSLPAVDLGPGRTATGLATGNDHACASLDDGTVKCWGRNDAGELGIGDPLFRGGAPGQMGAALPAVNLGPGRTALQLAVGQYHSCARLDDGTVKCWGRNPDGQLGVGDTQNRGPAPGQLGASLPPVSLGPGRTTTQVVAGFQHTCAKLDDGTLKCWGANYNGALGLGDTQSRGTAPGNLGAALPPLDLGPARTATNLAMGDGHTCASLDDATVKCWGNNGTGQLGLGDKQDRGDAPLEMGAALPTAQLK